ncbi:hypothetical protein Moror_11776 [Moniliophthora roreri MCA 2997]|uniref:Uncharacterized protein n=1 Tax=Moniliophthora roreri (strain MCA 2997) TaxID=1381753 RepID=V2WR21_MONRO|nr:hypothetical protein Moror_11776 [Moniliophthora roreri MCA 2997]
MPRKRLYNTPAERRLANAERSLRWYYRNKDELNAKRRKKTLKSSAEATIEDTAATPHQRARERSGFGVDDDAPRCSKHLLATHSKDQKALLNQAYPSDDEYWKLKLVKIQHTFALIGAGGGTDRQYTESIYDAASRALDNQQAYDILEGFHTRLEKLRSDVLKCQGLILEHMDNGDMYRQYEDMRVRVSGRLSTTADMACHALSGGISELVSKYRKLCLAFQK